MYTRVYVCVCACGSQRRPYFETSGINRAENVAQLAVSGEATAARHATEPRKPRDVEPEETSPSHDRTGKKRGRSRAHESDASARRCHGECRVHKVAADYEMK